MKNRAYLLLVSTIVAGFLANEHGAQRALAQTVTCELSVGTYGSLGPCVIKEPGANLRSSPRAQLALLWTESARVVMLSPASAPPPWKGVLIFGNRQVTFEIVPDPQFKGRLVMLNSWSWVRVYEWREIRRPSGAALGASVLSFGLGDYARASADDISILESSIKSLDRLRNWDREDDRNCSNDKPGHSSLFCLLTAAVEKRMGRYHHRQPALALVRSAINERWSDRVQDHPVMDFNNHSSTTRQDVRAALESALRLAKIESASAKIERH